MSEMTPVSAANAGQAEKEKIQAALSSVVAAIGLTAMKIIVGLLTGSLGILAEAVHSGVDLAAAAMTFFAVRLSGRPPDKEHAYGHGKIENLSALLETLLLLVTCVWIVYEAVQRLLAGEVEVEANILSFLVMSVSIAVDYSRSRALKRAAEKYNSQALEADALHFSTDMWSSSVVLVGLVFVWLARRLDVPWLAKADALAALGVSAIVVYVSLQLGRKTVTALLDGVPAGVAEAVKRAAGVPGVIEVKQTRVRQSGPHTFADVVLTVERATVLEEAHDIANRAEAAIRAELPDADVVAHVEPAAASRGGIMEIVHITAGRHHLNAHSPRLYTVDGTQRLEVHLELSDELSVGEAHARATEFEKAVQAALPELDEVVTHLEPAGNAGVAFIRETLSVEAMLAEIEMLVSEGGWPCRPHAVTLERSGTDLALAFHCTLSADIPLIEAHDFTAQMERRLRLKFPQLERVVIHIEPPGA